MIFTGRNLKLVAEALDLALAEVHNMIATCPDVVVYAAEIEAYEKKRDQIKRLKARVDDVVYKNTEDLPK